MLLRNPQISRNTGQSDGIYGEGDRSDEMYKILLIYSSKVTTPLSSQLSNAACHADGSPARELENEFGVNSLAHFRT